MPESRIRLSEFITDLREELKEAQQQGKDEHLKFRVEETEIELQVVVSRGVEGGGGVKFWVYNAEAKGTLSDETTQTIRLKLKPEAGDEDVKIAAKQ